MLGGTFQPVVSRPLHRWELENLEPMGQAVFNGLLRFVRVTHFCVELRDVSCDFLLGLGLGLAGKHFAALDSLLVEVPDDALPAAICPPKNIAVCCETFLCHVGGSSLLGVFFNHQHYPRGGSNVQTYVLCYAEKNSPAFW